MARGASKTLPRSTRLKAQEMVRSPAYDVLRPLYSDEDMVRLLSTRFEVATTKLGGAQSRDFRRAVGRLTAAYLEAESQAKQLAENDVSMFSKWSVVRIVERIFGLIWSLIFFDYDLTKRALEKRDTNDYGVLVIIGIGLVANVIKFLALERMYLATLKLW